MANIYKEVYGSVKQWVHRIDPLTKFGKNVRIGEGVVIDPGVKIGNNVFIGHNTVIRNNVTIGDDSVIGHLVMIESDTTIGKYVTIQSQCHITKFATIEDNVFFGPMAMCINTYHIKHGRNFELKLEGPVIRFGARIGAGSVLMPGVEIGREAEIGANSTVTKNCKPFWVYVGSPAKAHRRVHENEKYKS